MESLPIVQWFEILAVVLIANALTLGLVWGVWTITRIEKNGGKVSDAPWSALLAVLIPCGFVIFSVYLGRLAE